MISQIVFLKKDIEKLQLDLLKKNGELEGISSERNRAVDDGKTVEVEKNHLQLQVLTDWICSSITYTIHRFSGT